MSCDILFILYLFIVTFLGFSIYKHYRMQIKLTMLVSSLVGLSIILSSYLMYSLAKKGYTFLGYSNLEMETTGQFGDFIGGVVGTIVSFIGVILLIRTLQEQKVASRSQSNQFLTSQAESRFFELLKFHRDNVNELKYMSFASGQNRESEHIAESRHVFVFIKKDFFHAFEELSFLFRFIDVGKIYMPEYLQELENCEIISKRQINKILYAQIDLIYQIVFFGVGKDGIENIRSITLTKYKSEFVEKLIRYAKLKPKKNSKHFLKWKTINDSPNRIDLFDSIIENQDGKTTNRSVLNGWLKSNRGETYTPFQGYYDEPYYKYYGGHQFRLSHYFRHLYQIVCYVNDNANIDLDEKKNYIRILRGQLSTDEQIIFFFNSVSQLGRVWEFERSKKYNMASQEQNLLISKYNILKNIKQHNLIKDFKVTDFYPN